MRTTVLRLIGIVTASALVASCGEQGNPTNPAAVAGSGASRTLLASATTVHVATRNTPLATSLSTSAVIGAFGGTLSLPGAGLQVVVPAFALTSPTLITVTALAGNQVAYQFDPHGTQFLVPLVVTQNLVGTSALSGGALVQPLVAGYWNSLSDLDPLDGTASVTELLSVSVSLVTDTATFSVVHFSGYLVATGVTDSGGGSTQ